MKIWGNSQYMVRSRWLSQWLLVGYVLSKPQLDNNNGILITAPSGPVCLCSLPTLWSLGSSVISSERFISGLHVRHPPASLLPLSLVSVRALTAWHCYKCSNPASPQNIHSTRRALLLFTLWLAGKRPKTQLYIWPRWLYSEKAKLGMRWSSFAKKSGIEIQCNWP